MAPKTATKPAKAVAKPKDKKVAPKKADKKVAKKPAKKEVKKDDKHVRYFKIIDASGNTTHGRFSGSKPKQAANKALTSILKGLKAKGKKTNVPIKFSIVECTRRSHHKRYYYIGERIKLKEPNHVQIGGKDGVEEKTISYNYTNKVQKDKSIKPEKPAKKEKKKVTKTKKTTKKVVKKTTKKGGKGKKVAKKPVKGKKTTKKVVKKPATKKAVKRTKKN